MVGEECEDQYWQYSSGTVTVNIWGFLLSLS